jgi:molecular chaperone GrpE
MTEKKHHKQKEEMNGPPGEEVGTGDHSGQPAAANPTEVEIEGGELESMKQKLAEADARSAQNLDGWQRAVAEFQNYKKRVERDRDADQTLMKGDLIKKVLPILDDLERALENRPADDAWTAGIDLIKRKLQSILEAEGVKRIEAEGAVFDPNFHEAISTEPVDGLESGRVVAIVQNGYMLGDRVVRPAQVRVAR